MQGGAEWPGGLYSAGPTDLNRVVHARWPEYLVVYGNGALAVLHYKDGVVAMWGYRAVVDDKEMADRVWLFIRAREEGPSE